MFFSDGYFDMVIQVNLTVLLVLTTLWVIIVHTLFLSNIKCKYYSFLGISNSLPQTGGIKMIDVWLIFTMLYPFMSVMLHSLAQVNIAQLVFVNLDLMHSCYH